MTQPEVRLINVLLIEDDAGDVLMTREAFDEYLHNRLDVVTDGAAAMTYLRKEPPYADTPRPDLVLLDLNLPRRDGREVLQEIKDDPDLRHIPVVVLTTSQAEEDAATSCTPTPMSRSRSTSRASSRPSSRSTTSLSAWCSCRRAGRADSASRNVEFAEANAGQECPPFVESEGEGRALPVLGVTDVYAVGGNAHLDASAIAAGAAFVPALVVLFMVCHVPLRSAAEHESHRSIRVRLAGAMVCNPIVTE